MGHWPSVAYIYSLCNLFQLFFAVFFFQEKWQLILMKIHQLFWIFTHRKLGFQEEDLTLIRHCHGQILEELEEQVMNQEMFAKGTEVYKKRKPTDHLCLEICSLKRLLLVLCQGESKTWKNLQDHGNRVIEGFVIITKITVITVVTNILIVTIITTVTNISIITMVIVSTVLNAKKLVIMFCMKDS